MWLVAHVCGLKGSIITIHSLVATQWSRDESTQHELQETARRHVSVFASQAAALVHPGLRSSAPSTIECRRIARRCASSF